ncbi:methyltransferase domain-containing protein [Candidatus Bathyarchaeota archaeon]|nr:methyltransferase domain-containing protein [Candidatus Bathyarchaeota archaeon]
MGKDRKPEDPVHLHGERRRAEVTRILLSPQRDDEILDVGCGGGYQLSHFADSVAYVVGVDISKDKLVEAKKKVGIGEFVQAISERLPFKIQVFSKVLCLELLEHLRNPLATLNEIGEILSKEGILILSVPLRERIIMTQCVHCGEFTPLWGHIHSFDERKISSFLLPRYALVHSEYLGSMIASHPLFEFLPTRIWKALDSIFRHLPGERTSWIISKARKTK